MMNRFDIALDGLAAARPARRVACCSARCNVKDELLEPQNPG